ncbi:MAG TPA: ISKra4 family transposase [Gammaproteobacteria bacterium]|nr:ISKra4 family transposase [Gammaproteobacteria bacterium]
MAVKITSSKKNELVLEVTIPLETTMLDGEQSIEQALNKAGAIASGELLQRFDTDGGPIQVGTTKLTSKGQVEKAYQTPYGEARIKRHVYQTPKGGATFCPLETNARILNSATPKLAKMISHKYSKLSVDEVRTDFQSNHGRVLSRGYIQKVSETVGVLAQAKEEQWHYATPLLDTPVATVGLGLDGTTIHLREQGYRETMVGTLTLYDVKGKRLHTTYIGASPEYGKSVFKQRMEREIDHIKQLYPDALYVGVADGAADNWSFLNSRTDKQVTDFWHASEYLAEAAEAIFPTEKEQLEKRKWLDERCHKLKHLKGAAGRILKELKEQLPNIHSKRRLQLLNKAISYFTNQKSRMNYYALVKQDLPIGSGVTEAACKMIVKQRLCQSGMKWNEKGASIILSLRTLERSSRWEQFWGKISQYGVAC